MCTRKDEHKKKKKKAAFRFTESSEKNALNKKSIMRKCIFVAQTVFKINIKLDRKNRERKAFATPFKRIDK